MPQWLAEITISEMTGAAVALAAVGGFLWKAIPFLRRIGHFLDDWWGEPARGSIPARPGVLERLAAIEHEVTYNSGGSLKDQVRGLDKQVSSLSAAFHQHSVEHRPQQDTRDHPE